MSKTPTRLRRTLGALCVGAVLMLPLAACEGDDGPLEELGEEVDDAIEDVADEVEDAVDGDG